MNWPSVGLRSRERILVVLVIAGLVATAAPGLAEMSHVIVTPEAPTEEDPIHVQICGWFANGCWSFQGFDCGTPGAGEIALDVFALDEWQPGYVCLMYIVPYGCACEYDPLPSGHYVLTVTEHHASLSDPLPNIAVVEFDVLPLSPVKELSWARIRALYR